MPGLLVGTGFILWADVSVYLKGLLLIAIYSAAGFSYYAIRHYAVSQLRTSTNIVEAIVSGDYSLRANIRETKGVIAEFNGLLNALTERLSKQRLISREQQILLTKIINQIDVAIVACDEKNNITLLNPAAERLFDTKQHDIMGWPIKQLNLHPIINLDSNQSIQLTLPGKHEQVLVKKDNYLENGQQNTLVFITHIQDILREEERKAWQRLLRVLSHEINNSLAPIASIAETLISIENKKQVISEAFRQDFVQGLNVVQERAHSLNRFIQDYHRLAKLPSPTKSKVDIKQLAADTAALFPSIHFELSEESLHTVADKEQLQQVLVNLIKNADEANRVKHNESNVSLQWHKNAQWVVISITDEGAGIQNTDNLFVPYYSTKKGGSGIGLVLCRQIVRNHGGELSLSNREDSGVVAQIKLPSV